MAGAVDLLECGSRDIEMVVTGTKRGWTNSRAGR
jgi:hypothetical protein